MINNSLTENTTVELPKDAEIYSLSGNGDIRSTMMYLNGMPLGVHGVSELSAVTPEKHPAGKIDLTPATCTFIVI